MGKRMLHDNICTSAKIDMLTAEEERLYIRLLTHLDDYGNHPADPKAIRMACFPRKKKWNNRTIKVWLDRIVAVGLASYYEVQAGKFVHFERFGNFQKQTHIKNCPQGNCVGRAQHAVGDGRQRGIRMSRATDPVTFHSGVDRGSRSAFMGMNTNNLRLSSTSTKQLERMIDDTDSLHADCST